DCMVGKFLQHNLSLRLPTSQSAVILSSPDETTSPPSGEKPTDLMRALFVSVQSLWEVGDLGRKRDVGPGCAAGVVDHIGDPAVPTETDRNYAVEPDISIVRHLNRPRQEDVGVTKHTVDAQTPGFVAGNCAGDLIRGPAVGLGRAGPTDLIG